MQGHPYIPYPICAFRSEGVLAICSPGEAVAIPARCEASSWDAISSVLVGNMTLAGRPPGRM
jgi:hypothetical protein